MHASVALLLLLAPSVLPASATAPSSSQASAHPGVSGEDLGTILLTLARGHEDLLALVSPLHTGAGKVSLPPETMRRVHDPPALDVTLGSIASAFALGPVGRTAPLPVDLERALSTLGQGVLAAEALRAAGEPYAAGLALRDAYSLALPLLERDTILLSRSAAYMALASAATSTAANVEELQRVRDAEGALRLAGIPRVAPVEPRPLPEALAALYLQRGLPVDIETRAALAASSALDPQVRAPLETALAHLARASALRDEAFAGLTPAQRALLARSPDVHAALVASPPTAEDLALLAHYGAAVDAFDRASMLEAAGHALAASGALTAAIRAPDVPVPCCTGEADPDTPSRVRVTAGGLVVESESSGYGEVRLWIGEGDEEPTTFPNARAAIDRERLSLVVYDGEDTVFTTPALADPGRDVLFQDPYGLVVVSGHGATRTDGSFGAREVVVRWAHENPPVASPVGSSALRTIDAALARADPYAAWPVVSEPVRRALDAQLAVPTEVRVLVNPASYQILRWDLGGNDTYLTNAGGAGTRGLLAARADGVGHLLRENTTADPLPVALLLDVGGNDLYETRENGTLASANGSVALLVDARGVDTFRSLAPHGLASADVGGVAILLAGDGNSSYEARNASAVRAAGAATSLLADAGGDDRYRAENASLAASELGNLAILLDTDGNDTYRSRGFSQGASRGGVAALVDASGNDTYDAGGRADAQGWAEPYDGIGAARIALLLDAGGADSGACPAGDVSNAQVGSVSIARAPTDPFRPAAGFCVETDASPVVPQQGGAIALPPTFFASALANFTLPGVLRFGTLGDDTVLDPYVVSVDLLGNDTYAVGAAARVSAAGLATRSFGWLAPVSVHVDTDGSDTYDARLARHELGGAFGFADGGIALHAATSTLRFESNASWQPLVLNDTAHLQRYRNVTRGMGAAENGGVAIFLREGIALEVVPGPHASPCLLACARTGGVALALGHGPGDRIVATPWSLGAVQETELGGLALYYSRGGRDAYSGSNLSMGYAAQVPGERAWDNLHAGAVEKRPNVALFVDDGFEKDDYAEPLNWTHGNERFWEDRPTLASFQAFGNRSFHAAQGVDNLDWYANANVAAADEGIAEDTGPGTNQSIETPIAPPEAHPYDTFDATYRQVPRTTFYNLGYTAANLPQLKPVWSTLNGTFAGGENLTLPPILERGDGGSATTPDGVRPVTLARTPFNPDVEITFVSYIGAGGLEWNRPGNARVADSTKVRIHATDPPAYAEQTAFENLFAGDQGSASDVHRGSTIARVELSVLGRDPWWTGCPVASMRDRHIDGACVVASWDREENPTPVATDPVWPWNPASRSDFEAQFHAGQLFPDNSGVLFPPGNYTLVARAYAARPYGLPTISGNDVRLGVLQGLASDALNLTDDSYGLYGSASFADVPFLSVPKLIGPTLAVDSNGQSPALFQQNVTEPVLYKVDIIGVATGYRETVPKSGMLRSLHFNDSATYHALGHDVLRFEWNATGRAVGEYAIFVNMTGNLTNATANTSAPTVRLYVDEEAPWIGVDPRGMPPSLNATNSPGGVVTLTTDSLQLSPPNAGIGFLDLWVQEDILDAADPSVVLETRPWRHALRTNGLNTGIQRIDRTTGEQRAFGVFAFQAEPEPGPPRRYTFVAYITDRAGNRVVPDPSNATPTTADCAGGLCATFYYDISPPRTALATVDPPASVGRVGLANVTVRIDKSETPDVAQQTTLAAVLTPAEEAAFDRALLGIPAVRAAPVVKPNLTVFLDPGERALAPGDGFARAGETLNATVRVRPGSHPDDYFNADRGLHLRVRVLDALSSETVAGPWEYNVTGQLPVGGAGEPILNNPVVNGTVGVDVRLPARSGVYTLSVVALPTPGVENMTRFTELREGVVVWDDLPAPDANGIVRWQPPREKLAHGNSIAFLTRGVDHAGNVEEKTSYDARLQIDLVAPVLTATPDVSPASHAASFRLETDEPSLARLDVVAPNGTIVANATLRLASIVHAITLGGLRPETSHTLRLELSDEVGNVRNETLAFATGRLMDVTLAPLPAIVAGNTTLSLAANATLATRVEHAVDLSTDGGASFPHGVGRLRAVELGNTTRGIALDPSAYPDSSRAQLRLTTTLLDLEGARVISYSPLFTIDGRAPVVSVASDRPLDEPTRFALRLDATAVDNGTGVARVEWSRAGGEYRGVDGTLVFEGVEPETILVRALDRAGHASPALPVRLPFDRIAPTVDARSSLGATVAADVVPVRLSASDAHAGLREVVAYEGDVIRFRLSGNDLVDGEAIALWSLGEGDGSRALRVVAADAAGNVANATLALEIDRRAPIADLDLVERGYGRLGIEVSFDEPAAVLATISSRGGARILASDEGPVSSLSLVASDLAPGEDHRITLRMRDLSGNVGVVTRTYATRRDIEAPPPLDTLTAMNLPDGSIALAWSDAFDVGGVRAYHVVRGDVGGPLSPVASVEGTRYVDVDVRPGATYEYAVVPMDSAGNLPEPKDRERARSRTAPRILEHAARWDGGALVVELRGEDLDGDAPTIAWIGLNASQPLKVHLAPDGWRARVVRAVAPGVLGDQLRYHLEVDDGLFIARWPPTGDAIAPPAPAEAVPEGSAFVAAAQRLPLPSMAILLGALLATALLWRRRA